MPFIGNKPTAVPLSSADLEDDIITSAKITDGTITLADLSATGTKDATTFLRGDNTFASAGGTFSPRFSAHLSGNQSISNASDTTIQLNTEIFDEGGCFNNTGSTVTLNGISTPAYCFAPNVAGIYVLGFKSNFQTDANHYSIVYIYKNASNALLESQYFNELGNNRPHSGTVITSMNGTSDYVYLACYQNSGSAKNIYGSNLANTHFFGYLLKAT